jgi:hypothetical protein
MVEYEEDIAGAHRWEREDTRLLSDKYTEKVAHTQKVGDSALSLVIF